MFGLKIVSKSRLDHLERMETKFQKVVECHRWFAGWSDLDIIWDYIMEDTNFGGISRAREDYAKARKTNEYGAPKIPHPSVAKFVEKLPTVEARNKENI